jgi:hypothetical protein
MQFSEVVRRRRMVRQYSGRPLSPEVIERVLTSALGARRRVSPGAGLFWRSPTQQTGPLLAIRAGPGGAGAVG